MGFTTVLDTTNQLYVNVDQSQIFLGENEFISGVFENTAMVPRTIPAGRLIGRIASGADAGKLIDLNATATNGSQFPVGVLTEELVLNDTDSTANCTICISGYVAEDKLVFFSGEGLNTIVSSRSLRDRIAGDTLGIRLLSATNLTKADNF